MGHNKAMLIWEVSRLDHTTNEVPVAYTTEVDKKGES